MSLLSFVNKKLRRSAGQSLAQKKKVKPKQAVAKKAELSVKPAGLLALGIDLRLLLTEKGVRLQEQNVVTFRVVASASKGQIARAIEERYGTKPRHIRTVPVLARRRRRGNTSGTTAAGKKAYVQVDDVHSFNGGV